MKTQIPWHLPNTQKSVLLKTKESHFSLVWVMEFSIISSCLGKVKVFPIILACQSQTTFNICMKTVNGFYVSNRAKGLSAFESGCGIDSRQLLKFLDIQATTECRFTPKRVYGVMSAVNLALHKDLILKTPEREVRLE